MPCAWQRCGTCCLLEDSLVFVTQSHGLGAKKVFEALNHVKNLQTAPLGQKPGKLQVLTHAMRKRVQVTVHIPWVNFRLSWFFFL